MKQSCVSPGVLYHVQKPFFVNSIRQGQLCLLEYLYLYKYINLNTNYFDQLWLFSWIFQKHILHQHFDFVAQTLRNFHIFFTCNQYNFAQGLIQLLDIPLDSLLLLYLGLFSVITHSQKCTLHSSDCMFKISKHVKFHKFQVFFS